MLITTGLLIILSISRMVSGTFWDDPGHRASAPVRNNILALFFSASSIIKLLIFFLVMPRLRLTNVYRPMFFGFVGVLISQAILVTIPVGSFGLLALATIIEACTLPVATALLDKLVVLVIDPKERARIMAIIYVIMILFTSPFGWIAGQMSQTDRILPFVLNIALYGLGAC